MTDPQATAQPTKTYEDGLREAAEIARAVKVGCCCPLLLAVS